MKISNKVIAFLLLVCISLPGMAETARVRIGKVRANINTNNENNTVSISQAGNVITIGYGFTRTIIKGINTRTTSISQAIQFEIEGELESGQTYRFDSASSTPIVTALNASPKRTIGYSTTANFESSPNASGSLKVISYNSETGELKANFNAKVSPIQIQRGTKVRNSSKGVRIRARINAIVD